MWVPSEEIDPILFHAPIRKSATVFGAVNLRHRQLVSQFDSTFDAITFEAFLRRLLRHRARGRQLRVILDNARYHHARLLAPFLSEHWQVLTLEFLPPDRPNLNAIERVWKLADVTVPTTNTFHSRKI